MRQFSPKDPTETRTLEFDFSKDLAFLPPGSTLTGQPTFSIVNAPGYTDPNVSTMLLGSPQLSGAVVMQMCTTGIAGNRYAVSASCGTSTGEIITQGALLSIVSAWQQ